MGLPFLECPMKGAPDVAVESGCFPLASCFGSPTLCASLARPMSRGIARCHTDEPRASSLVNALFGLHGCPLCFPRFLQCQPCPASFLELTLALVVHYRFLCGKGLGGWGRGASHFCCIPKLAPWLVDPCIPGEGGGLASAHTAFDFY